jgi:hypothetical protein
MMHNYSERISNFLHRIEIGDSVDSNSTTLRTLVLFSDIFPVLTSGVIFFVAFIMASNNYRFYTSLPLILATRDCNRLLVSHIGPNRFSEKWWVWNGVHSTSPVQLRSYLKEKVAAPVDGSRDQLR